MHAHLLIKFVSGRRKRYSRHFWEVSEALSALQELRARLILQGLLTTVIVGCWVEEDL